MISWDRPEWWNRAKCLGASPHLFYPEKYHDSNVVAAMAKAVCNGLDGQRPCTTRSNCLEWALANNEKFGIWGGCSESDREDIKRQRRKEHGMTKIVRKPQSPLKALLETRKVETRVLGSIQRHLLVRPAPERAMDWIHPSEMAKGNWCPRATFYRLAGAPGLAENGDNSFTLENIFQEGHDIHRKWQTWLWEMGVLRGEWQCLHCDSEWEAVSPSECPKCEASRGSLRYREVPLCDEVRGILGHSDGDIADDDDEEECPLLEVKSIGVGTLRFEAPALLAEHSHRDDGQGTWIDYEGIWRDIKRPFPSHLRQGQLYMFLKQRKSIVFIYECKWNQQVKEFVVRYQPSLIQDLLDSCLEIQEALKIGMPVLRPDWADPELAGCKGCNYLETCWNEEIGACSNGAGNAGAGRTGTAAAAEVRNTEAADTNYRIIRRRSAEPLRSADTLD